MSGKEYEKFYELFRCDPKDNRINLLIAAIITFGESISGRDNFKPMYVNRYYDTSIRIFDNGGNHLPKQIISTFFMNIHNGDHIHKEWGLFFKDLFVCAYSKTIESNTAFTALYDKLYSIKIDDTDYKMLSIKMLAYALYTKDPASNKVLFNQDVLHYLFNGNTPFDLSTHGIRTDPQFITAYDLKRSFMNLDDLSDFLELNLGPNVKLSSTKHFTYNYERYVKGEIDSIDITSTLPGSEDFWIKLRDNSSKQMYTRRQDGHIYDKDNNIVDKEIFTATTGICTGYIGDKNGADKEKCGDFIMECLKGGDMKKCKEYFTNESGNHYWEVNKEISSMTPMYIQLLIKALVIPRKSVYNAELNINIETLVSSNEWLASLEKHKDLERDDVKNIRKNKILITFINKLISFVNTEPAILNPNYIKDDKTKAIVKNNIFSNTTLFKFGLLPNFERNSEIGISPFLNIQMSDINRLHILITDMHNAFYRSAGIRGLYGGNQSGGNHQFEDRSIYNDNFKFTYNIFKDYYKHLMTSLSNQNKSLNPKDKKDLEDYLDKLENSEKNLKKGFKVIEEYSRMIHIIGDGVTESLSLNKLEELTKERNKKFERVAGRQNKGLDMLRTLVEKISDISQ